MELGGHAPVIVYPDFDPIAAAKKLATTKFRNCGQVCISPSRFYVHHSIIEPFAKAFVEVAKNLKTGSGLDEEVTTGPMIRERSLKMHSHSFLMHKQKEQGYSWVGTEMKNIKLDIFWNLQCWLMSHRKLKS